jgi:bifunctional non-homologous end joining protein LigD
LNGKIKPMLARLEPKPFNDSAWLFETKYDGIRAIVDTRTGQIWSRSGKEKTGYFPEIKPQTRRPAILDGEIVAYANGKSDFNIIQHRGTDKDLSWRVNQYPAQYEVFDILEADGVNLMSQPLSVRKKVLEAVLVPDARVHLAPFVVGDGEGLFQQVLSNDLEGIIGKRLDSRYLQDAREWVKVKKSQTETFLVCGYTAGTGWRASTFGALVLGKVSDSGVAFVGEVGTGFNDRNIDELFTTMSPLKTNQCPFPCNPYTNGGQPSWVIPSFRVIVKFLEYTNTGVLRFPAWKGIVK